MTDTPEVTKIFTLKKLPFHNSDGSSDVTIRYGDNFVLEARFGRRGRVNEWIKTTVDTGFKEKLSEYEFNKLVPKTNRAVSKVEIVYNHRNKVKWTVDLYRGSDIVTARLDNHTDGSIEDWMQDVIIEEITQDDSYTDSKLALNTISLKSAESIEKGDRVVFIPEGIEYDFGYIGGTGKVIIYKVGERSMQDASAVEPFNVSVIKKDE